MPVNEQKLRLAVLQIRTETDYDQTMEKAHRMLAEAAAGGADIAVLPEMFACPYDRAFFKLFAARGHEETVAALAAWAREFGLILVGGSVPEREGDKLYNTAFVFDAQGRQLARHRKVHLFDVDLPGMCFHESHTFTPGKEVTTLRRPSARWASRSASISASPSSSAPWPCAGRR